MGEYTTKYPLQREEYLVEHLASFPQDMQSGYKTPEESLDKLKRISSEGGLWSQNMKMSISVDKLVMANGETMEMIEEYPMEQINLCITILDDNMFENLLIFATKPSAEKVGAVHLFQCSAGETDLISGLINYQMENKLYQLNNRGNYINEADSRDETLKKQQQSGRSSASSQLSSDSSDSFFPAETRTQYNLQQKHKVARVVRAFQDGIEKQNAHADLQSRAGGPTHITKLQDAKITRDVEILNKCIEEVENFVVMLKRINEARKQLQSKKGKSKKKKAEEILILQAQPPPDHRVFDIYQKFKHGLNLLGKLQPHISDPSAPELIHYLFIPLGIVVKVTGLEKARSVLDPLLTEACVELLQHILDSREYQFWQSLGPNWTLTKSSDQFKQRYIQAYVPVFIDGWVPPEVVPDEKHEAAATAVARMQEVKRKSSSEVANCNPAVIQAAMKFKDSVSERLPNSAERGMKRTTSSNAVNQMDNSAMQPTADIKPGTIALVLYDYLAHNDKELTIQAGEKVIILDSSRRWWFVQNSRGEQGYVPSTVLEVLTPENSEAKQSSSAPSPSVSNRSRESNSSSPSESNEIYVNQADLPPPPQPIDTTASYYDQRVSPSPPITHHSSLHRNITKNTTPPPTTYHYTYTVESTNSQPPKMKNMTPPPQPVTCNTHYTQHTQYATKNAAPRVKPCGHVVKTVTPPPPSSYESQYAQHAQQAPINNIQPSTSNTHKYTHVVNVTPPPQPVTNSAPVVIQVRIPEQVSSDGGGYSVSVSPIPTANQQDPNFVSDTEGSTSHFTASTVPRRSVTHDGRQNVSHQGSTMPRQSSVNSSSGDEYDSVLADGGDGRFGTAVLRKVKSAPANRNSPNGLSRTTPPIMEEMPPPPPPPPPIPAPPPPPPPPQPAFVPKVVPYSPKLKEKRASPLQEKGLQSELMRRLSLQSSSTSPTEGMPNIDSVDVFIPLYKSSTADDVSRWLKKLRFNQDSIDILKGKSALELFNMDKETLVELIGAQEGKQLFDELLVQNGAKKRNETMTEFQKALVHRVKMRETEKTADDSKDKASEASGKQVGESGLSGREPGRATFGSFKSDNMASKSITVS